ncbi:hypothetical protein [Pedobacter jamesrossensis]|uniref:Uncharacterized protein n=1 Tax=Pedobacter jamesrossensis TaxID=1908238 RepID=A0ABV8NQN5_9SPHI
MVIGLRFGIICSHTALNLEGLNRMPREGVNGIVNDRIKKPFIFIKSMKNTQYWLVKSELDQLFAAELPYVDFVNGFVNRVTKNPL